ncbi:hypothetical protein COY90_00360 [Candidatus Roizmanbacteria bacterium CG_4_10_14_0_8_um_filter_39_9]|uniref:Uncharacterized protein n=1 Tax=Candidatus Roizmanbacteria bacterium CG_4_10_14_0_8_um_filter_39_9 TaxID=1974829 RepID=A0A2M7QF13_9BACT|nr:MAG: hypothetical protein COY90_00360 [Candidatus Roizmanbacteria bacterium CG_4_10_14_0_8_um_filter_39_9]
MTTIVNSPAPTTDSGGNSFLIGVVVLIGFVAIFLYFGLPAIKRMGPVQMNVPAPQVNIPDKINVNVNQGE